MVAADILPQGTNGGTMTQIAKAGGLPGLQRVRRVVRVGVSLLWAPGGQLPGLMIVSQPQLPSSLNVNSFGSEKSAAPSTLFQYRSQRPLSSRAKLQQVAKNCTTVSWASANSGESPFNTWNASTYSGAPSVSTGSSQPSPLSGLTPLAV